MFAKFVIPSMSALWLAASLSGASASPVDQASVKDVARAPIVQIVEARPLAVAPTPQATAVREARATAEAANYYRQNAWLTFASLGVALVALLGFGTLALVWRKPAEEADGMGKWRAMLSDIMEADLTSLDGLHRS